LCLLPKANFRLVEIVFLKKFEVLHQPQVIFKILITYKGRSNICWRWSNSETRNMTLSKILLISEVSWNHFQNPRRLHAGTRSFFFSGRHLFYHIPPGRALVLRVVP
jgi:hypothetical protein